MVRHDEQAHTNVLRRHEQGEYSSPNGICDIFEEIYQIPIPRDADYDLVQQLCVRIEQLEARPFGAGTTPVAKPSFSDNAFIKTVQSYFDIWHVDCRFSDWAIDATCIYFDEQHALKGYVKYVAKKAGLSNHRRNFLYGELSTYLGA